MTNFQLTYANSHALIVGIDDYVHLLPLNTASRGALAVEQLLQSTYGFNTHRQIDSNASKQRIIDWFRALRCGPDDRVIFFFSGRGWMRPVGQSRRRGFLMMRDGNPNAPDDSLKIDDLVDEALALNAKHVLLLIDACFDGLPTLHSYSTARDSRIAVMMGQPVRQIITAGSQEVPDESTGPDGNYSVFTHFLLKGLQGAAVDAQGFLHGSGLAGYLERAISNHRASGQKPLHGLLEEGMGGEFVFHGPSAQPAPGCDIDDRVGILDENHRRLLHGLKKARKITVLKQITTGQSGSAVYLVGAEPHPPHQFKETLYYCKIYRTDTGHEKDTHERAAQSGIGKFVPRLVDYTDLHNGWMASLYSVAHNTTNSFALSRLLEDNVARAKKTLGVMVEILRDWNPKAPAVGQEYVIPLELLRRPFRPYEIRERVIKPVEEYIGGLTHMHQHLQFTNRVLPNPLYYIASQDAWAHPNFRPITVPYGHIHGDLHANNIICWFRSEQAKPVPVFIDFDTYDPSNNIFYDYAYLEYDIARRLLPPGQYGMKGWLNISQYLANSIALSPDARIGYQAAMLVQMLQPLRRGAAQVAETVPFDYEVAFWIARASVGMAFARKRKLNPAERRMGMLIAAHSMARVLELFDVEEEVTHPPFFMRWQDELPAG